MNILGGYFSQDTFLPFCGMILFSKFSTKFLVLLMLSVHQPEAVRGIKLGK